jgi:hypothetical protein
MLGARLDLVIVARGTPQMQPKAILVCAALLLAMTASPAAAGPRHEARTGYIVALHPAAAGPSVDRAVARLEARAGFRASTRFSHALRGFAARLTERQHLALLRDPSVAAVVPDRPIELAEQTLPTGVDRVDADSPTSLSGIDGEDEELDVDIAIIDTGIQPDHPDLRVVGGHNCVPNGGTTDPGAWADVASHGTHVAGIAPTTPTSLSRHPERACGPYVSSTGRSAAGRHGCCAPSTGWPPRWSRARRRAPSGRASRSPT